MTPSTPPPPIYVPDFVIPIPGVIVNNMPYREVVLYTDPYGVTLPVLSAGVQ